MSSVRFGQQRFSQSSSPQNDLSLSDEQLIDMISKLQKKNKKIQRNKDHLTRKLQEEKKHNQILGVKILELDQEIQSLQETIKKTDHSIAECKTQNSELKTKKLNIRKKSSILEEFDRLNNLITSKESKITRMEEFSASVLDVLNDFNDDEMDDVIKIIQREIFFIYWSNNELSQQLELIYRHLDHDPEDVTNLGELKFNFRKSINSLPSTLQRTSDLRRKDLKTDDENIINVDFEKIFSRSKSRIAFDENCSDIDYNQNDFYIQKRKSKTSEEYEILPLKSCTVSFNLIPNEDYETSLQSKSFQCSDSTIIGPNQKLKKLFQGEDENSKIQVSFDETETEVEIDKKTEKITVESDRPRNQRGLFNISTESYQLQSNKNNEKSEYSDDAIDNGYFQLNPDRHDDSDDDSKKKKREEEEEEAEKKKKDFVMTQSVTFAITDDKNREKKKIKLGTSDAIYQKSLLDDSAIQDMISKVREEAKAEAEADRIAKEKAEADRIAKEKEEREKQAREKAEKERLAKEKAEKERLAREKAEKERIAREKAEKERRRREREEEERIARERALAEKILKERAEKERLEKEKKAKEEADRIAKEKAEAERIAKEKAEQERLAREKAERDRIAKEKAEKERKAREKAEKERIAKENAEKARIARERALAEKIQKERAEKERIEREKKEAERKAEEERLAREKAEKERIEREKAEAERLQREKEEAERLAREKAEKERIEREKAEAERLERERREKEERARLERERKERERIAREKALAEKIEKERLEKQKQEDELRAREKERIAKEKAEAERLAKEEEERIAREKAEAERLAKEEEERIAREKAEAERLAKEEEERIAREKAEAERLAKEEEERIAREKAEAERLAKEEEERIAREKAEAERLAKEEEERIAREKAEAERLAKEEEERIAREKAEAERLAKEEEERIAREKAEAERLAKEEEERIAREKAEAERLAKEEEERIAREKAEAERQAKEEAERQAKEEAERQAKEEAERQAKEEAERQAKEEAERLAKEEAERQAKEEAERKAKEEEERKAKEEAERQAKEEAERKAKEEEERKAREKAEAEQNAEEESGASQNFTPHSPGTPGNGRVKRRTLHVDMTNSELPYQGGNSVSSLLPYIKAEHFDENEEESFKEYIKELERQRDVLTNEKAMMIENYQQKQHEQSDSDTNPRHRNLKSRLEGLNDANDTLKFAILDTFTISKQKCIPTSENSKFTQTDLDINSPIFTSLIRPPQTSRNESPKDSIGSLSASYDENINWLESEIALQLKEKERLQKGITTLLSENEQINSDVESELFAVSKETVMNLEDEHESLIKQIELMKNENENAKLKAEEIQKKIEDVIKFREVLQTQLENAENAEKPEIKKIKKEIEDKEKKLFDLQKQAERMNRNLEKKKSNLNDLRFSKNKEYLEKKAELLTLKRRKKKWETITDDENTTFEEFQELSKNLGFERNRLAAVLKVAQKEMIEEREKCESLRNQYLALNAMVNVNPQ